MPKKIVRAFDPKGKLVGEHTIVVNTLNAPTPDSEFVDLAKKCLAEDDVSQKQIDEATFEISDI